MTTPAPRQDATEDLRHDRQQKGATHSPAVVGNEIDDAHEDNADHLSHSEQRDTEKRAIER